MLARLPALAATLLVVATAGLCLCAIQSAWSRRDGSGSARFELEAAVDSKERGPDGPVWRAHEWFLRHPLLRAATAMLCSAVVSVGLGIALGTGG